MELLDVREPLPAKLLLRKWRWDVASVMEVIETHVLVYVHGSGGSDDLHTHVYECTCMNTGREGGRCARVRVYACVSWLMLNGQTPISPHP